MVNGIINYSKLVVHGSAHRQTISEVKINASHEEWHLSIVASQTANIAASAIRIGSNFERWYLSHVVRAAIGVWHLVPVVYTCVRSRALRGGGLSLCDCGWLGSGSDSLYGTQSDSHLGR